MTNLNQNGIHFTGPFTEADCNEYFGLLNELRPGCINVKGAEQYPQALEFAKTCAKVYPGMRTIFRHMIPGDGFSGEDTGRWTKMSARDWWLKIGSLYKGTGLTILLSNEDTMEDYSLYNNWLSEAMTRAGDEGLAVAYLRFPTHHPRPSKEQQLDKTLITAFRYGKLHSYSPNAYWAADNHDAFKYIQAVISYAEKLGITLDTTIGEYALLRDIRDAYNGWKRCGVEDKAYALDGIIKARVHLPGIPVSWFGHKKWPLGKDSKGQDQDTFGLTRDIFDTMKANLTPLTPIAIDPIPTHPLPPYPPTPPVVITPAPTIALPLDFARSELAILAQQIADERQTIAVRKLALAADEARLAALEARASVIAGALGNAAA